MTEYQGHRSWNAWNVALWIANDYSLYSYVKALYDRERNAGKSHADAVAKASSEFHFLYGGSRTPDGGKFTRLAIKLAIQDLFEE